MPVSRLVGAGTHRDLNHSLPFLEWLGPEEVKPSANHEVEGRRG